MKDPYANLYEVTEIHDLRDVIKKRVNEFPENPVFLVKEKKVGNTFLYQQRNTITISIHSERIS